MSSACLRRLGGGGGVARRTATSFADSCITSTSRIRAINFGGYSRSSGRLLQHQRPAPIHKQQHRDLAALALPRPVDVDSSLWSWWFGSSNSFAGGFPSFAGFAGGSASSAATSEISSWIWFIKRTFQPSIIRKKRKTGFLVRQRTVGGRRTINRRRHKGRWILVGGI